LGRRAPIDAGDMVGFLFTAQRRTGGVDRRVVTAWRAAAMGH
jgi:hypothetical protein